MNILPFPQPKFLVMISVPHTGIVMDVPTVGDHRRMLITGDPPGTAREMIKKYGDGREVPLTEVTAAEFLQNYAAALKEYREANTDIMMVPHKRDYSLDDEKKDFPVITDGEHMVYRYSGLDIARQQELLITEYWVLLADAVKNEYRKTKAGREYLDDAYIDMHADQGGDDG